MSLAARIAARSRRPTATVRLGGRRWRDVLTLSRDQSYGQGISGGEVVGRNPPVEVVEGETTIAWSWGYDGYEVAGFSGVVSKIVQRSYPNQWRLQVADPLWLADIRRSDVATDPLNSIAASAAIEQILGAAGIARMAIPELSASGSKWVGSEWVLGTLTPVSWTSTTALNAAQDICSVLGYWLYCDASGVVRATLMERRPSSSPFRTLRWDTDFLLASPPERERDAASVKNRVVVRGANTGVQGAQVYDVWQTGDADRTQEFSSFLIEFVNESEAGAASCTGVAKRVLKVWGRQPNVIRVGRLKADPRLAVGMTLAIQCSLIGYSAATPFFIYSLSTTLDLRKGDFAQSLTLDGGTGDQGYTTLPPPEASFTWRLVKETLDGAGVVEVFLDGTGSHSLGDGEIVSYAWSSATAVATGFSTSATGARALFVYPAATTTAAITLTVTDTSSKTGSLTQTITLAGDALTTPTSRVISLALGSAWAVTPDGGATWRTEARTACTLVPELGGATLLASDGATVRATADGLSSASTLAATLGGTLTAFSQTEDAPARVWAAVGTALYLSLDTGATFALWGTLPASVTGVLEDPAVPNSVFVLAGANVYHSTLATPGTSWVVLYAGPVGATARQLVRGASGATTWIAYTGTFVGAPLQRIEGPITASWPLGTSPDVTEVRAIALSTDELTCYAWDAQGRGWAVSSETGIATAITATLASGETAQHALMDPDEPIVYLATFGATAGTTYKYFPSADVLKAFYTPAAGQQAHRVGLGAAPFPPFRLLAVGDSIYLYERGAWSDVGAGLPAGWTWVRVVENPFTTGEWLALGAPAAQLRAVNQYSVPLCDTSGGAVVVRTTLISPLWRTADGGATWSSVALSAGGVTPDEIGHIEFSDGADGGTWYAVGNTMSASPGISRGFVWRGSGTASTSRVEDTNWRLLLWCTTGQDGDLIVSEWEGTDNSTSGRLGWLSSSATSITQVGGTDQGRSLQIDRVPLSRQVVGLSTITVEPASDGIWLQADYRSDAARSNPIDGGYEAMVAAASDAALFGSIGASTTPIYSAAYPLASAAADGLTTASLQLHAARAARDDRSIVAVRLSDGSVMVRAAGEWHLIAGPGDTTYTRWIEVSLP